MKVNMLRNPGRALDCELTEGETGTVDTALGEKLVAAGIAIEIEGPKPKKAPKIETVPPKPAIAEAKPAAIKAPVKPEPKADTNKPETPLPKSSGDKPQPDKES